MKSAPDLPRKNFTAMLRLDHNRAASQLAAKTGKPVAGIEKLVVWGNHSPTMYADYRFATIDGQPVKADDQRRGLEQGRLPADRRQARRGDHRGARACRRRPPPPTRRSTTCATGRSARNGKWVTMGIASDGQYGIPKDVMFGFPVTTSAGEYETRRRPADRRLQPAAHRPDAEGAARGAGRRQAPAVGDRCEVLGGRRTLRISRLTSFVANEDVCEQGAA